jgi:transcriptional regulator with XRE-family HTH domain
MIICWTRKEIAEYLGVTTEHLRKVDSNRRKLSKKRAKMLADFYDEKMLEIVKANKAIKKFTENI